MSVSYIIKMAVSVLAFQ